MRLISHRGNLNGPNISKENHPEYIMEAIYQGYDVEIDVWYTDRFMLGHDKPQYKFPFKLLEKFHSRLWIHCKNLEAITRLKAIDPSASRLNYFWHEKDTVTLTSKNYIWAYPGKQPVGNNCIAVMPENMTSEIRGFAGICSDIIGTYRND